jgi:hypothetical protein
MGLSGSCLTLEDGGQRALKPPRVRLGPEIELKIRGIKHSKIEALRRICV